MLILSPKSMSVARARDEECFYSVWPGTICFRFAMTSVGSVFRRLIGQQSPIVITFSSRYHRRIAVTTANTRGRRPAV